MLRNITIPKGLVLCALAASFASATVSAQDYVTVEMEIDVDRPAAEVWDKVGGYCDIAEWFPQLDCEITSGDGGIGTVRALAGGRVIEILVAQTDLSYAYAQPAVPGQFYDLYHGQLEAKPVTDSTSKLLYTLVYDASETEDVEADMARRRNTFETALANMKEIAESE